MVNQFYGNHGTVTIGATQATVSTATDLSSGFTAGVDFSAEVTEVRFTDAESGVEVLNVLGTPQLIGESRPDLVKCELTMILDDMTMFNQFYVTTTTIATTWKRISGLELTGTRNKKCLLFKLAQSATVTNQVMMNNAYFLGGGEISLAADGRATWTGTVVCLVTDMYTEFNY
jgi:hypothetical protein